MAAAWIALLRYGERVDNPAWLGRIKMRLRERLGVMDAEAAVRLQIIAEVLAQVRGDPGDVIEGRG